MPLADDWPVLAVARRARLEDDASDEPERLWLEDDERSASAESSEVWPADDALRECEELPVSDVCDSLE